MKKQLFSTIVALVASAASATLLFAQDDSSKVIDLWQDNTDASYATYSSGIRMGTKNYIVYTARYTEFNAAVKGDKRFDFYCGGERTWLGTKNGASIPDWKNFSGDLHIYPYTKKAGCGFYGLLLSHGGKTFNVDDLEGSLGKCNSELVNCTVTLHEGATLATWTGVRGVRIAELNTEVGSHILGAAKGSSSNGAFFALGQSGFNTTLAGKIYPANADTRLGLIKEGEGGMEITGNDNLITGAVRVLEGTLLLNNDVETARNEKLGGAIGAIGANPGVIVSKDAMLTGSGHSASIVDLYGMLDPGNLGSGTFTIADFKNGTDVNLRLRPTSKLLFEIDSAEEYDRLCVSGNLDYWNIGENLATSEKTPIIYILPAEENSLKVGDRLTLITAKGKTAKTGADWQFRIQFPKLLSWKIEEVEENGEWKLIAEVTSLLYTNQGDIDIDSFDVDEEDPYFKDYDADLSAEMKETTPLRQYAESLGKYIGIAAPCWSYSLTNFSDANTQTIGREFNMVVSENGMKFENTEPSKNSFSWSLGDACVSLGQHYNCLIRGHSFVWHKQNAAWVTENDNKNTHNYSRDELLEIMKNHIFKVAAHYKGKVSEWDVVNECLADDQSALGNNPEGYTLRPSVWNSGIGEDFIEKAFQWAREADQDIKLYLTDYGVEFCGMPKAEAFYNLAKSLKDNGVPIDGVGLQCHFDAGRVNAQAMAKTIERFKELGLECIITELDLGCDGTEAGFAQQAKDYAAITKIFLTHDNCPKMMIWGLKDSDSWRGSNPLLFKENLSKKPAYHAVHRELRKAAETNVIENIEKNKTVIEINYYNAQGQRIDNPQHGVMIVEKIYNDKSRSSQKIVK